MFIDEKIMLIGGIALAIGIIMFLIAENWWFEILEKFSLVVIGISGVMLIGGFIVNITQTTRVENEPYIIVIEDKQKTHTTIRNPKGGYRTTTHYYFYFNETEKVQVNSRVYNENNIGDTVMINMQTTYKLDRRTGEEYVQSIIYN